MSEPVHVAVYVCTHRRNDALRSMLTALLRAAENAAPRACVAAVVIDDNPDGRASEVVDEFEGRFALGIHYRHSGEQNISVARNLGLETAAQLGEWVAMTDDDCEPDPTWISSYLDVQKRTGADAMTGPLVLRFPEGNPAWLYDQPFALGENEVYEDGRLMHVAQTHNSIISSAWLREHPDIRFEPGLGRLGGEDMVFYRRCVEAGMRIYYARDAVVHEIVGPERATLHYQLRTQFWLGNSEYVTNTQSGAATRARMVLRGARRLGEALQRPIGRLARHEPPQWRWCLASLLRASGMVLGALGLRVDHH
jgi:succinoglycan biosynthesis protein ExoM